MFKFIFVGALSFVAFAPYNIFLVVFITHAWLYIAIKEEPSPNLGELFLFGFGYHIGILYWLYMPLLKDGAFTPYQVGLAPIVACMILSTSFIFVGKVLMLNKKNSLLVFPLTLLASSYVVNEPLLRFTFSSGFPWAYVGYSMADLTYLNQIAFPLKIYGLNLFVYLISALLGEFILTKDYKHLRFIIALVSSAFIYSYHRLSVRHPDPLSNINVSIVQPNISHDQKLQNNSLKTCIDILQVLSGSGGSVIWPESCLPYVFRDQSTLLTQYITKLLPECKFLIMGATRLSGGKFYNSLLVINHKGEIISTYDKNILVPFGEFTPLKGISFIKALIGDKNEYTPGFKREVVSLPGFPTFLPLICYEVIFPCIDKKDAQIIINLTNDDWFGITTAPYQHLAIARIRAIELNAPILRAANSGISAIIDQFGRIRKKLDLYAVGSISN